MSKQINQYTKERDEASITLNDLVDLDSTDDNGSTYESAKITILSLRKFLTQGFNTIYNGDNSIGANRTVSTFNNGNFFIKWVKIDNIVQSDDIDRGYKVQDLNGLVRAYLSHDTTADSGVLSLYDANGEFLNASEGKVGIGTITPTAKLQVKGDSDTSGTTNFLLQNSLDEDILKVLDDGRVGVGITSPTAKLHVDGDIKYNGVIEQTSPDLGNKVILRKSNTGVYGFGIQAGNLQSFASTIGNFHTWGYGDSDNFTERMRLNVNGLGIGITSATAKLQVKGSGATSGTTNFLLQNSLSEDLLKVTDDGVADLKKELNISDSTPNIGSKLNLKYNGFSSARLEGSSNGILQLYNSSGTRDVYLLGSFQGYYRPPIVFGGTPNDLTTPIAAKVIIRGDGSSNPLHIQSSDGLNTLSFLNSGNLGLGITSATAKLQVKGSGATIGTTNLLLQNSLGEDLLKVTDDGKLNAANLPTVSTGLSAGDIWNDGGTLKIV